MLLFVLCLSLILRKLLSKVLTQMAIIYLSLRDEDKHKNNEKRKQKQRK
jgi:hypothetical protein